MNRLSRLVFAAVLMMTFGGHAAAAELKAIHNKMPRIVIKLERSELATLEKGQEGLFSFDGDFFDTARVIHVDPVKRIAALKFEQRDERLKVGMTVTLARTFWNSAFSPVVFSPVQHHPYEGIVLGVQGGYFGEQGAAVTDGQDEVTYEQSGTRFSGFGYSILLNDWIGASMGFDTMTGSRSVEGETFLDATETVFRPGVWVRLDPTWRLSLGYEYNMLSWNLSALSDIQYDWELPQLALGLGYHDRDFEAGFVAFDRAKAKALGAVTIDQGVSIDASMTMKYDSEVWFYMRSAPWPTFLYHLSLGYVFYERDRGDGDIGFKIQPEEVLRFRSHFEHRLESGSKFDWGITYDGAHARGKLGSEMGTNRPGLLFAYRFPVVDSLTAGSQLDVQYGERYRVDDDEVGTRWTSLSYQLLLRAQWELEVDMRRRRR